jgi:Fe-S oxidoreductase
MVATAAAHARDVSAALAPHLDAGRDVVVVEPSDLAMFRRGYSKLLPDHSYRRLCEHSYEVMEYVYGLLGDGADPSALRGSTEAEAPNLAYHSHCQQRTLGLDAHTIAVLEDLGYDVLFSEVECCGMAGSFGYKSEYFELSLDVGEPLREQFSTIEAADRAVIASGTSCLEQLDALIGTPVRHPVEVVAPDVDVFRSDVSGSGSVNG